MFAFRRPLVSALSTAARCQGGPSLGQVTSNAIRKLPNQWNHLESDIRDQIDKQLQEDVKLQFPEEFPRFDLAEDKIDREIEQRSDEFGHLVQKIQSDAGAKPVTINFNDWRNRVANKGLLSFVEKFYKAFQRDLPLSGETVPATMTAQEAKQKVHEAAQKIRSRAHNRPDSAVIDSIVDQAENMLSTDSEHLNSIDWANAQLTRIEGLSAAQQQQELEHIKKDDPLLDVILDAARQLRDNKAGIVRVIEDAQRLQSQASENLDSEMSLLEEARQEITSELEKAQRFRKAFKTMSYAEMQSQFPDFVQEINQEIEQGIYDEDFHLSENPEGPEDGWRYVTSWSSAPHH